MGRAGGGATTPRISQLPRRAPTPRPAGPSSPQAIDRTLGDGRSVVHRVESGVEGNTYFVYGASSRLKTCRRPSRTVAEPAPRRPPPWSRAPGNSPPRRRYMRLAPARRALHLPTGAPQAAGYRRAARRAHELPVCAPPVASREYIHSPVPLKRGCSLRERLHQLLSRALVDALEVIHVVTRAVASALQRCDEVCKP